MNKLFMFNKNRHRDITHLLPILNSELRSGSDRRATVARRHENQTRLYRKKYYDGRRVHGERRAYPERRIGWFKIGKWNSSCFLNGA